MNDLLTMKISMGDDLSLEISYETERDLADAMHLLSREIRRNGFHTTLLALNAEVSTSQNTRPAVRG